MERGENDHSVLGPEDVPIRREVETRPHGELIGGRHRQLRVVTERPRGVQLVRPGATGSRRL